MKRIMASLMALTLLAGTIPGAQARYYDPGAGRFLTPDTFVQAPYDPQSLNRDAYARNNPIKNTDPSGHFWFLAPVLIGAGVGAVVTGTHGQPFSANAWQNFDWQSARVGAVSGAVAGGTGAAVAFGLGSTALGGLGLAGSIGIGAGSGAAAGFAGYSTAVGLTGSQWSWEGAGLSAGTGAAFGGLVGGVTSPHLMPYLRGSESFTGIPSMSPGSPAAIGTSLDAVSPGPQTPEPGTGSLPTSRLVSAAEIENNPILGLPRVGHALKTDPYHNFSSLVDNYASMATRTQLSSGARLYQLLGADSHGVSGRYEWIVQNGQVTHRFFVQGGTLNGVPILP